MELTSSEADFVAKAATGPGASAPSCALFINRLSPSLSHTHYKKFHPNLNFLYNSLFRSFDDTQLELRPCHFFLSKDLFSLRAFALMNTDFGIQFMFLIRIES
ncbi:hypothetical protein L1887_19707 [Cichorium endivia]|nr:hypothetical protein L1887_19707 [Cichorium endivia]